MIFECIYKFCGSQLCGSFGIVKLGDISSATNSLIVLKILTYYGKAVLTVVFVFVMESVVPVYVNIWNKGTFPVQIDS